MRSSATATFWKLFKVLPVEVQKQARVAFRRFKDDPFHPSLRFQCVDEEDGTWPARIGIGYRALGIREGSQTTWFWIGSHADYDSIV